MTQDRTTRRWGRTARHLAVLANIAAMTVVTGCSIADPAPRAASVRTSATEQDSAERAEVTYLPECGPDSLVKRPSSYILACADGGELLDDLTWRAWGEQSATATGQIVTNNCNPSCSEGRDISSPVKVVADQLSVDRDSSVYRRLTVTLDTPGGEGTQTVYHLPDTAPAPGGGGTGQDGAAPTGSSTSPGN